MMITKKLWYISVLCVILAACSQVPKEAYFSREPESLLDVSSEVVNLKIDSPASVREITNWVNQDQPTRAEVHCPEGDTLCNRTRNVLHQFGVPVRYTPGSDNTVALIYERILARDCENRYIDNRINPYNLNYVTFGCSVNINTVQMVSDKRQFTSPALMDYSDANKVAQSMGSYNKPSDYTPAKSEGDFQPIVTQTTIQTNGLTGGTGR
jgi:hypothetical protein